jgi:hypothetical protein
LPRLRLAHCEEKSWRVDKDCHPERRSELREDQSRRTSRLIAREVLRLRSNTRCAQDDTIFRCSITSAVEGRQPGRRAEPP